MKKVISAMAIVAFLFTVTVNAHEEPKEKDKKECAAKDKKSCQDGKKHACCMAKKTETKKTE